MSGNVAQIVGELVGQFKTLDSAIDATKANVKELAAALKGLTSEGRSAAAAWRQAAAEMQKAAQAASKVRTAGTASGADAAPPQPPSSKAPGSGYPVPYVVPPNVRQPTEAGAPIYMPSYLPVPYRQSPYATGPRVGYYLTGPGTSLTVPGGGSSLTEEEIEYLGRRPLGAGYPFSRTTMAGGGSVPSGGSTVPPIPPWPGGGGSPLPYVPPFGGISMGGVMSGLYTMEVGVGMVEKFFSLLNAILDKATALNTELVRLRIAGESPGETKQIEDLAYRIAKQIPGRAVADIVTDLRHMRSEFGEEGVGDPLSEIKRYLPKIEEASVAIKAVTGEDSGMAMGNIFKTIALRGDLVDPKTHEISYERFNEGLDAVYKMIVAGNGFVTTRDALGVVQQAGPAARMFENPSDFWKSMLAVAIDMRGQRAGTALTAGARQMFGDIFPTAVAQNLEDMGLLKPGSWHRVKGSVGRVEVDKNGWFHEDVLEKQGIYAWMQSGVREQLAAHGVTDDNAVNRELYKILTTETFRRLASVYLTQHTQVERDAKLMEQVQPIEKAVQTLNKESASRNMDIFTAAWNNLMAAVGSEAMPAKISMLQGMANVLRGWTDEVRHPSRPPISELFMHPTLYTLRMYRYLTHPSDASADPSTPPPAGQMLRIGGQSYAPVGSAPTAGGSNRPVPVVVTNGRDLIRGVSDGQAGMLNRPQSGYSGSDPLIDPSAAFYGTVPP